MNGLFIYSLEIWEIKKLKINQERKPFTILYESDDQ